VRRPLTSSLPPDSEKTTFHTWFFSALPVDHDSAKSANTAKLQRDVFWQQAALIFGNWVNPNLTLHGFTLQSFHGNRNRPETSSGLSPILVQISRCSDFQND